MWKVLQTNGTKNPSKVGDTAVQLWGVSKRSASQGDHFCTFNHFNLSSYFRNLKKWNSNYCLPFSFTLKSMRCPGELDILRWWWQNFLTANNFNKMSYAKGCSCYKWVGKHVSKMFFSLFSPLSLFLSFFKVQVFGHPELFACKSAWVDVMRSSWINFP